MSIGAGALWADAYEMVTTRGGRYVQGGGCRTVGVAGLVQGGGFGSWSKRYGTGAAGLLEAEIITADGVARVVNECLNPDLSWAIKGGGGGTFGVVTRFTLHTRELPEFFGAVSAAIRAASDEAYRALIAEAMSFYRANLFNAHWGEKFSFRSDNTLDIGMLFQGLARQQERTPGHRSSVGFGAEGIFLYATTVGTGRSRTALLGLAVHECAGTGRGTAGYREGAPPYHAFWKDNEYEAGQLLHAYKSAWLPAASLDPHRQRALADAIFASSRHWGSEFHFNKGLAGASAEEIASARNTATNPQVLDAFALVIIGSTGPPAYPGMAGPPPDLLRARDAAAHAAKAMEELLKIAPGAGAIRKACSSSITASGVKSGARMDLRLSAKYESLLSDPTAKL